MFHAECVDNPESIVLIYLYIICSLTCFGHIASNDESKASGFLKEGLAHHQTARKGVGLLLPSAL